MVSTISRGEKTLMRSTDLAEVRGAENSPVYSRLLTILALTHTDLHNDHMYTHINDLNDQLLHLLITKASSLTFSPFWAYQCMEKSLPLTTEVKKKKGQSKNVAFTSILLQRSLMEA